MVSALICHRVDRCLEEEEEEGRGEVVVGSRKCVRCFALSSVVETLCSAANDAATRGMTGM
jgi:hypothetical protein